MEPNKRRNSPKRNLFTFFFLFRSKKWPIFFIWSWWWWRRKKKNQHGPHQSIKQMKKNLLKYRNICCMVFDKNQQPIRNNVETSKHSISNQPISLMIRDFLFFRSLINVVVVVSVPIVFVSNQSRFTIIIHNMI